MNMASQGKRFYMNPSKTEARWLDPPIQQHLYAGWQDVTDLSPDELLVHIQSTAYQAAAATEEQLELFNESKECTHDLNEEARAVRFQNSVRPSLG
ncbi:hypothetical protein [Pseudomonas sp. TMP25]|uniref:hypothetical protein n=1 Tax=Pseudomonas sp. TMP25 TaxID=3136561 RepID=UPI00310110B1